MSDLTPRLVKCFRGVFPGLDEEAVLRAGHDAIAMWDSIAMLTLVHVIEEEFRITIGFEDLENLTSFAAIRECVAAHLAAA